VNWNFSRFELTYSDRGKINEKTTILKKHLIDRIPVSDLCDQYNLQPTVFYSWQKKFFENGATALENSGSQKKAANEITNLKLPEQHEN